MDPLIITFNAIKLAILIETHQPTGDFKAWWSEAKRKAATRLT